MAPDFWIEIHYWDERSQFSPFLGDRESAKQYCAQRVAMDAHHFIESILLLSGDYIPGQIATKRQILEVFQGYPAKGFKKWK